MNESEEETVGFSVGGGNGASFTHIQLTKAQQGSQIGGHYVTEGKVRIS